MLQMDQEPEGQVALTALKKLGNELYLAGSESAHATSLIQFNKKKTSIDQWTSDIQCYWFWKLGHKSSGCMRRAAGEPKLQKPGSIAAAPGGSGSDIQAPCGRCKGKHLTKNCYHDPANATKRPAGWTVKTKDQKDVGSVAIDSDSSNSFVKVHRPDFSIIVIEQECVVILDKAVDLVKPDFSLVAIDSSAAQPESAIDAQLLLIQDKVNKGHMTFPDNFELLYDKNVWIFDTGMVARATLQDVWMGLFTSESVIAR
jgi:hypothetical protein